MVTYNVWCKWFPISRVNQELSCKADEYRQCKIHEKKRPPINIKVGGKCVNGSGNFNVPVVQKNRLDKQLGKVDQQGLQYLWCYTKN